jgi:hypothetical protein
MACRDQARGERAAQTLRQQTGNEAIHCTAVDLSSKAAIESLARAVEDPVHVLINNAATTPRERLESDDGTELQFATNVLGYFRMIQAFTPHMEKAGTARVVNVASYWAGGLELDDLEYKRRRYDNDGAYRQPPGRREFKTEQQPGLWRTRNPRSGRANPGLARHRFRNRGSHRRLFRTPTAGDLPVFPGPN